MPSRTPDGDTPTGSNHQPDSAEVLRKQLRTILTKMRQDAGMTQKAVATALDWGLSKVVRIEQGTVPVAPSDVRVLLSTYKIKDENRIEELVLLARSAREARSLDEYDDLVSPTFRELITQESHAHSIWKHSPLVIPGFFQTTTYARSLMISRGMAPQDAARRVNLRDMRQRILDTEVELNVIVGEVALIRPIGGLETMREQLNRLLDLSDRSTINISVLPLSAGAHSGMDIPFTVLQFEDMKLDDAVYLEDAERKSTARDESEIIERYLDIFSDLREIADRNGSAKEQIERALHQIYGVSEIDEKANT